MDQMNRAVLNRVIRSGVNGNGFLDLYIQTCGVDVGLVCEEHEI